MDDVDDDDDAMHKPLPDDDIIGGKVVKSQRTDEKGKKVDVLETIEGEVDDEGESGEQEEYTLDGKVITIEPFHLGRERDHGYFDGAGNYVETRQEKEGEAVQDAWLAETDEWAKV